MGTRGLSRSKRALPASGESPDVCLGGVLSSGFQEGRHTCSPGLISASVLACADEQCARSQQWPRRSSKQCAVLEGGPRGHAARNPDSEFVVRCTPALMDVVVLF